MIVYKLEWTTQYETTSSSSLGSKYSKNNIIELYMKQEAAETKKKSLEESARLLGFVGLNAWVSEIEIIE